MPSFAEAFAIAAQHCESGELHLAEGIYRQILAVDPKHADAWHLLGVVAYQGGKHEDAIAYIRRGLQLEPNHAQALGALGHVLQVQGRIGEAIDCFRRSLALQPRAAVTHYNLGTALERLGDLEESGQSYLRAVEIDPNFVEAWTNAGNVLQTIQKFDEAIDCFRTAIKLRPDRALAHYNLGVLYKRRQRLAEAGICFRRTLELEPGHVAANGNLGAVLYDQGEVDEAVAFYRRALELDPRLADVLNNLGIALHAQGELDESVLCYRRALELQPNSAEVHSNIGTALIDSGKLDDAIASLLKAVELRPDNPVAHNNLGNALQAQGKLEEAIVSYRSALALNPKYPAAYHNLGFAFAKLKQLSSALNFHSQALALQPENAEAHFGRATLKLLLGDLKNGWPEYEWRWKTHQLKERDFSQPLWDGSPLGGRTVLLHAEQGFGDTFQFIRYAALVKKNNAQATAVVECQPSLVKILARCAGIDQLIGEGDRLPEFDVHCPLLSLPGLFSTTMENIPGDAPYVFPDRRLIKTWHERLSSVDGLRIGINWQGRSGRGDFRDRDVPEKFFARLAQIEGVSLISLQKKQDVTGPIGSNHGGWIFEPGHDFDSVEGAFMDTAAVMMNVDLVISSDTSIPHLAGGLGVPVWAALPFVPDWRWLLDRSDSPWYPTMRLFRQKRAGDWGGVFEEIGAALAERVDGIGRQCMDRARTAG